MPKKPAPPRLVRVTLMVDGVRKYRKRLVPARTPPEVVAAIKAELLAELRAAFEPETQPPPEEIPDTVASYAVSWMRRKARTCRIGVATHYADTLERFVLPYLGDLDCRDVTRGTFEAWCRWAQGLRSTVHGRPYARTTMHGWWRVAGCLLRDMAADYDIPDPTRRVPAPTSDVHGVRERETLTRAQLDALLGAIEEHHPQWYAETFVAAWTGVRAGELYSLRWCDVDLDAATLHVERSHWEGHEAETKTGEPRTIPLTASAVEVLRAHRDARPGLPAALLFTDIHGGHRRSTALRKVLRLASVEAGLPLRVTPQVLRRTLNTLLETAGTAPLVTQDILGHGSRAMTERYHRTPLDVRRAAIEGV